MNKGPFLVVAMIVWCNDPKGVIVLTSASRSARMSLRTALGALPGSRSAGVRLVNNDDRARPVTNGMRLVRPDILAHFLGLPIVLQHQNRCT